MVSLKAKYWLCKRKQTFFSFDSTTGKRESLHTGDREAAKQIMRAKNDAATQPASEKFFAKVDLDKLKNDREWLSKATAGISLYWQIKNARKAKGRVFVNQN
jgi:hypothetical protein